MIVLQFPYACAPRGMAEARRFMPPKREEWQADGTWAGLFDVVGEQKTALLELAERVSDGTAQWLEIESEDEILNHRMSFLFFSDMLEEQRENLGGRGGDA